MILSLDYIKELPHVISLVLNGLTLQSFLFKYFYSNRRKSTICNATSSTPFASKRNFDFAK